MEAKLMGSEEELEALARSLDDLLDALENLRRIDPVMAPYCEETTMALNDFIEKAGVLINE